MENSKETPKFNYSGLILSASMAFLYIISGIFLVKTNGLSSVIGYLDLIWGIIYAVMSAIVHFTKLYVFKKTTEEAKNTATLEITHHEASNATVADTKND